MSGLSVMGALALLGLSEYEAKAYEALVRLGEAKPSAVTRESGIPQSKVYDVLNRLVDAGLVRVIPERPKRYVALPPDRLGPRITKQREQLEEAEKRITELGQKFASRGGPQDVGELWFLPNRKALVTAARDAVVAASATVHAIDPRLELMSGIGPALSEARSRGIDVRVVACEEAQGRFPDAEAMIRFIGGEGLALTLLLVDDNLLFLGVDEPPMSLGTRLAGFLAFGRGYTDYWWSGRHTERFQESFYPYLFDGGEGE
ncbi:MAG: helix-turn-helix domain-containing protein [Methanopyri archaeon]|nr:helix-turn-helix domain-containing protein [Methanopyri archaeon]